MLDDETVRRLLPPTAAAAAVRQACAGLRRGDFDAPPRTALADGARLIMPVHHRPSGTGVVKVVTTGPGGVRGTVTWLGRDGGVRPLADAGALTELRTAAVTAVALDAQARPDVRRLLVFGTGRQARSHARAFAEIRDFTQVVLVGRDRAQLQACCAELAEELPALSVRAAIDVDAELARADVVCCTTRASRPLFDAQQLRPDAHVFAVGSHLPEACELPRALLARAAEVVVDDVAACLSEAGEVIDAVRAGVLRAPDLVPLSQRLDGPPSPAGSVFKSVGVAPFDWALAAALVERLAPDARTEPDHSQAVPAS